MSGSAIADSPVAPPDPGPMARLEDRKRDGSAPGEIFRRLCEGETLPHLARTWKLPKGRFVQWFTTEHAELYDAALKVRADDLAHAALAVARTPKLGVTKKTKADGSFEITEEDMLGHRRLYCETMLKLASKWDRKRYGEEADAVRVTPVTIQIANLRGETKVQVSAEQPAALPAEPI